MTPKRLFALAVLAMLPLSPAPAQQLEIESVSGRRTAAREVLIKLQPGTAGSLQQLMLAFDADRALPVGNSGLIRLRSRSLNVATLIGGVNQSPIVAWAEPNYIIQVSDTVPNDLNFSQLWGLRNTAQTINGQNGLPFADIEAVKAWDIATGSSQIVVGVVDTGVDYTHPDLAPNVWTAQTPYQIVLGGTTITCPAGSHGFNAIALSCDPRDDHFHGTHVSGTIGARGNNLTGVTGVNWTTSIVGLKFLNAHGLGSVADAINAIEAAVQMRAQGIDLRVINASWGTLSFSAPLLQTINAASDILFVAAAGNNAEDNDGSTPFYPASYSAPNIIAVAATDNQDKLAPFSNYGLTRVHLGAPGVDIQSTISGAGYGYLSGTSMASPHVAGTAALLLSKCPLTTAGLRTAILSSVDPVPSLAGKSTTGGRVNAYRALAYCGASATPGFTLSASPVSMSVTAGGPASSQIAVAALNGFNGSVVFSASGMPSGVSASFSPPSRTGSGNSTITLATSSTTPGGTYPITVQGVSGSLVYTQGLSLTVNAPNFTLSASPASVSTVTGGTVGATISVSALYGFSGVVNLTASGMPTGVSASLLPPSVTGAGSSVLNLTASASTAAGTYPIAVKGISGVLARTATVTLVVIAPLAIATASLAAGQVGSPYSQTLAATGGVAPYTWTTISGRLPRGLTLDQLTGLIGGTPAEVANALFTFQVTDSTAPVPKTATASLVLTVTDGVLTIATAALANGQVGAAYSQTLAATGGAGPYTWALAVGSTLPNGLALNPVTGQIGGTPTAAAATPLTFRVTDSSAPAQTATKVLALTITPVGLAIATASLPNGQVGAAYTQTLAATGGTGPYTWALTAGSALPNGLTLNPVTGQIGGTPTAAANTPLTFRVTDSSSPAQTATRVLMLTITPLGLAIATASLPNGQIGTPYSQALAATGGAAPYTWKIISGRLPRGLAFNESTGLIGGIPDAVTANSALTFQVMDSTAPAAQTATANLLLTVTAGALSISTASLANGQAGVAYSQILAATGGTAPYTWALAAGSTLPNGLALNPVTGQIGGTPTAAANTPLAFQVTDSSSPAQTATKVLTLTIAQPVLSITTASLANGQIGVAYSQTLAATGGTGPYTWALSAGSTLPGGLALNPVTGQIGGTPTAAANTPLTFRVTDSSSPAQTATKVLTLAITPPGLAIVTASLPNGQVGTPYSQALTAIGGAAPYSWTLVSGRLPRGLVFNESTGLIGGTPTAGTANSPLTFQVTDSTAPVPKTATVNLTLTIVDAP